MKHSLYFPLSELLERSSKVGQAGATVTLLGPAPVQRRHATTLEVRTSHFIGGLAKTSSHVWFTPKKRSLPKKFQVKKSYQNPRPGTFDSLTVSRTCGAAAEPGLGKWWSERRCCCHRRLHGGHHGGGGLAAGNPCYPQVRMNKGNSRFHHPFKIVKKNARPA